MNAYYDRPCAAHGLTSYRYRGRYDWIMIGANNHAEALLSAGRSTDYVMPDRLEVWDGKRYVLSTGDNQ